MDILARIGARTREDAPRGGRAHHLSTRIGHLAEAQRAGRSLHVFSEKRGGERDFSRLSPSGRLSYGVLCP